MKRRQISPERKALYYGGMALSAIGFLVFVSVFFTAAANFGEGPSLDAPDINDLHNGNFGDHFNKTQKTFKTFQDRGQSMFIRAIVGMIMMIGGGVLMAIGAKGPAGAGLILDPEKARRDVEPWSRATGGMIKDGLDEAGIHLENVLGAKAGDATGNSTDFGDKLRELHRLYEEGILSREEYEREKRDILDKI